MIPAILLLNPPPNKYTDPSDYRAYSPSVGLGYIAASLLKEGFKPICVDAKYEGLTFLSFEEKIKKLNFIDIVGITSMTHNIEDAHEAAIVIKKHYPKALVVIGGCHSTALPEQTLKEFYNFDIAVIGEGEYTFVNLVKYSAGEEEIHNIKGIVFRNDSKIIRADQGDVINDLDKLPYPAWNMFDKVPTEFQIMTSRGCPYNCNFCMRVLGNKMRYRTVENIIGELKQLVDKYGNIQVGFPDETLTIDRRRSVKFFNKIIEEGLAEKISWGASARVDTVDEELISLMKESGCRLLGFGVESGNDEILNNTGKGITKDQAIEAIRLAKKYKIKTNAFFIFGHPNESLKTIKDTIKFAIKLNPTFPAFGMMIPYPGTKIRELALNKQCGYSNVSNSWKEYNKNLGNPLFFSAISKKQLIRLQLTAYLFFFICNFRFIELFKIFLINFKTIFARLIQRFL